MFESAVDYLNKERGTSFSQVAESDYEGVILIKGKESKLRIELGNGFPKDFPVIRVLDDKRFKPHASFEGEICLVKKEEVMIIPDRADELLLDSFDRAVEILGMDTQTQKKETFREFGTYWELHSELGARLYMNLPEAEEHEYREYTAIGPSLERMVVSDNEEESKALLVNNMHCAQEETEKIKIKCTRIRLRDSVVPPQMNEEFTWKRIQTYILDNITGGQKRKFNQLLSMKAKSVSRMIVLVIPSDNGDQYACVWLHSTDSKQYLPIRKMGWCKIDAVLISRIDQQYMLARGGAETGLGNKAVLLIGAGSVGGFLAENLCQCGVGMLDILDKDRLSIDNVHRHVLGFNDAVKDEYKADLLKDHLEACFPHVEIDSLNFENRTADTLIGQPERLLNYDLVISTTGNPNVDLAINDAMYKLDGAPPLIVCFNEPYGIGGHAILTMPARACLRCAYSDPISGELVPFLGSFVAPDQSFSKTLSGCAGSFVEYSVLDSQQTAIIATRLSLDVLNGKFEHSRIVSWLGPDGKLKGAGYLTSEFYEELQTEGQTFFRKDFVRNERCMTCGS